MMQAGTEDRASIRDTIQALEQLADGVGKDDLSRLAKMHGLCESLLDATGPADSAAPTSVRGLAASSTQSLATIILGEAPDPDAVLGDIVEAIATLERIVGDALDHPSPDGSAKDESDDAVSARLDRIFDDEPPANAEPVPPVSEAAPPAEAQETPPPEPPYESEPLVLRAGEIDFVKTFIEEAGEHIDAIEAAVLDVESSTDNAAKIDDLFRPFHTIKGAAGFLNLRDINRLTHEAETLLDQARKGERSVTPGMIDLLFDAVDILKAQIAAIAIWLAEPNDAPIPQPPVAAMIGRVRDVIAGRSELQERATGPGQPDQRVGENLVDQGTVPQEVVDFAAQQQTAGGTERKLGQTLVDLGAATPKQVSQALRPQTRTGAQTPAPAAAAAPAEQSIRIDTRKLDSLVDMVGELVIAQTQVSANPVTGTEEKLNKAVAQVGKIIRDVQELGMSMRMVPIGPTFQKMSRLVRDVSRKAGKQAELVISGEDTELDKNVIQQISDPLVHMVRNAVDHGLESPDERRAAGKSEQGQVYLGARHEGGNIVIEIRDDGHGLDPKALVAKAIEKGIVSPEDHLTDQQAFALIFAPGFSTAATVTDISGRGVGMDVVRRNIEQLRGKVEIESQRGQGSKFSIRLPMTTAIIDGMIVRIGSERFIIPTITIEQSLRPTPDQITTVQQRGELLLMRGELIPLIHLGRMFGLTERTDPCQAMVVIAHCDRGRVGLVAEELIGQQQVVIKMLGERFRALRGISGAAILGDGRVGLILEIAQLALEHERWRPSASDDAPLSTTPPESDVASEAEADTAPTGLIDEAVHGDPEAPAPAGAALL